MVFINDRIGVSHHTCPWGVVVPDIVIEVQRVWQLVGKHLAGSRAVCWLVGCLCTQVTASFGEMNVQVILGEANYPFLFEFGEPATLNLSLTFDTLY